MCFLHSKPVYKHYYNQFHLLMIWYLKFSFLMLKLLCFSKTPCDPLNLKQLSTRMNIAWTSDHTDVNWFFGFSMIYFPDKNGRFNLTNFYIIHLHLDSRSTGNTFRWASKKIFFHCHPLHALFAPKKIFGANSNIRKPDFFGGNGERHNLRL